VRQATRFPHAVGEGEAEPPEVAGDGHFQVAGLPQILEVFPGALSLSDGYLHPGEAVGHGVEIDERLAEKYPYQRAYLPVNRLEDGTLWHW